VQCTEEELKISSSIACWLKLQEPYKAKKGERQTMLYLTEENVSPASRTTGVSQVISCFELRGNAIVFTSIKLQFTN